MVSWWRSYKLRSCCGTSVCRLTLSCCARAESNKFDLDVQRVRKDMIQSSTGDNHDGDVKILHFNSAGDSPMPKPVLERVIFHLETEASVGGYEAAARCDDEIEQIYNSAASLINGKPSEIALQESASMGWARAFYALAQKLEAGDRILTSVVEYGANYVAMLQACKRTGAVLEVVPSDEFGEVHLGALEDKLAEGRVKVVAITHVPTNGGVINPAAEVGKICRRHKVLYILDACQSIGQLNVDVQEIGCHVMCATGRKFLRGPRGTGFLYISKAVLDSIGEPPMIDHYSAPWTGGEQYELRPDARRFEFWESNVAGRLGLGVALRYTMEIGISFIEDRVRHLASFLRRQLTVMRGVHVMDLGRSDHQCGIISFIVQGMHAAEIKEGLRGRYIFVSTSSAGSTPLDAEARGLTDVVRASVHYFNDEEDIQRLVQALSEVIANGSQAS